MKHEVNVSLNVHEIGVILSALQLLEAGDEYRIGRSHGSAAAIHDRLKRIFDEMDQSTLHLNYESYCEPSF